MIVFNKNIPNKPVRVVLFDFDGTFSILRDGWEEVMAPMILELLGTDAEKQITDYIGESTGIQTIHQMKWLAAQVKQRHGKAKDPWEYKAEYNRRLMLTVQNRREKLINGEKAAEDYLIPGTIPLILALKALGMELFVASGTDAPDVKAEAEALGIAGYFTKIAGATPGAENCAKEDIIREIIRNGFDGSGIKGDDLAVVGDGKVEIAIGRENGARTLGIARNDETVNRLKTAGVDMIVRDYTDLDKILNFFTGGAEWIFQRLNSTPQKTEKIW
jgi:phosphoglycolate phosphatase-like HAD superfamily hydrolase